MTEEKKPAAKTVRAPYNLIVDNRKILMATGVSNVDSPDDQTAVAYTDPGGIVIRGRNLQIGRLNTETGELAITGEIYPATYTDQKQSSGGGVFSKMSRQWGDGALSLTLGEWGQGFLMALAIGFALGAFCDAFRIFRVFVHSKKRQVIWQDIFVCFIAAVVNLLAALVVNWGEVRFYLLTGEAIGMCVYFLTPGEITFRLARSLLRILTAIRNFLLCWTLRPIGRLFCRIFRGMRTICAKVMKITTKPLEFRKKRKKSLETFPSDSV